MYCPSSDTSEEAVLISGDDISNYNPENILPESAEEIQKIRAWLKPTEYDNTSGEYRKHLASHLPGTGTWLTSHDTYRHWLESKTEGLLWIKGLPGSGKSVLAAYLVDNLSLRGNGSLVLYFFFRQIIDANHEPVALLRDWLDQILLYSPPLQKQLKGLMEQGKPVETISMEDHWSNLKLAVNGLNRKVICVADALDEMDHGNDEFLQNLAAFGQWMPDRAKVVITSRPVPAVEMPLRASRTLSLRLLERDVDIDIEAYVDHHLQSTRLSPEKRDLIKNAVPGRANGLFLYAKLAMDAFLEPDACVDDVLRVLPTDLHNLYTRLLREHSARSGVPEKIQMMILQWVTHATRPLRLLELAHMLNTIDNTGSDRNLKEQKDLIRAATGPLLEILPSETVCVIHHSFTEYLKCTTRDDDGAYPILHMGSTHQQLADTCLNYLQSGCLKEVEIHGDHDILDEDGSFYRDNSFTTQEEQSLSLRYPFFSYAATNWHVHVARSFSEDLASSSLNATIHEFLGHAPTRRAWLQTQRGLVHSPTPLHIAAKYGLCDYAQYVVEHGADIHALDRSGQTALYLAASSGHVDIIKILLGAGADPDVDERVDGDKPLHAAARRNHFEVIKTLLEAGVDPLTKKTKESPGNWCGNAPTSIGHTALMYACESGHLEALESFMPFLRNIDDVHRALQWSASEGRSKLVRRILCHPQVQVNALVRGDTALVAACRSHNRDAIVALIDSGADPTILCENDGEEFGGVGSFHYYDPKADKSRGFTALHALCCNRSYNVDIGLSVEEWRELITLLVEKGVDVNQKEHEGNTALHYAVDTPVAVRLLLESGADANALNDAGNTPLHLVRSVDSISLLVELGLADINKGSQTFGKKGLPPIYRMLGTYHSDMILKLLEYRPDLSLKDQDGNGPLHTRLKMWSSDSKVLKALLDAGADPEERNALGETPLHGLTADIGQATLMLDLLLEAGADINAKDLDGLTVLSRAVRKSDYSLSDSGKLGILIERGAGLNVRDLEGRTLLHLAIAYHGGTNTFVPRYDEPGISKFDYLLRKGMDHKAVDYRGNTLLHELALGDVLSESAYKYIPLAKELLGLGINPAQPNYEGRTALHLLAGSMPSSYSLSLQSSDHRTMFDLLVSISKDIDAKDNRGLTALHLASTLSELHVKQLLEAGADPTVASLDGLTPLHLAARACQSNIVGQLLDATKSRLIDVVDAEDREGQTPLYHACLSGRPETVRLLLEAGADATRPDLFEEVFPCFEWERALWRSGGNHKRTQLAAAGLTLKDDSRPVSAFTDDKKSADLDQGDTARLDEIIDMLIEKGASVGNLYRLDLNSEYTIDCFVRAQERHAKPQSWPLPYGVARFREHASKFYREAQLRAVSEFKLGKNGNSDRELALHLLSKRQYHTMEALFQKGVSFLEYGDKYTGRFIMHVLARAGFASLVQQIGDLEMERLFKTGKWHAFGDATKPGLYRKVGREDKNKVAMPNLLKDAIDNPQPNMEVVRLLVERFHVDVNDAMQHLAVGKHWWHVAQALPYLIAQGANVNLKYQEDDDRSLLHIALSKGSGWGSEYTGPFHKEAAKALIAAGADANAVDKNGIGCLTLACANSEMVELLILSGAVVDAHALIASINSKAVDVLETLLKSGIDPNVRRPRNFKEQKSHLQQVAAVDEFPLWVAATQHGLDDKRKTATDKLKAAGTVSKAITLLLQHGADPFSTFKRSNPSHLPKSKREGGNTSDENRSNLFSAEELSAEKKFIDIPILHDLLENGQLVQLLLEIPGLDAQRRDSRGRTLLHAACRRRSGLHSRIDIPLIGTSKKDDRSPDEAPSIFQHLVSMGADVLAVDSQNRNILHLMLTTTPLYHIHTHPILEALPLLSAAQIHTLTTQPDIFGNTPLHLALRYAIWNDDTSPASALLKAGSSPSAKDTNGNTALHILAHRIENSSNARALFTQLLDSGLDVNAPNAAGQTPVFNWNMELPGYIWPALTQLLDSGLDVNAPNAAGQTPVFNWNMELPGYIWPAHATQYDDQVLTPEEALAFFEDAGADLSVRDGSGESLLHVAARWKGYKPATRFEVLVGRGLDVAAEDDRQRTALDVAAACGNVNVLKMFEGGGVKVGAAALEADPVYDSDDMGF